MKKVFYLTFGLILLTGTFRAQVVSNFSDNAENWRSEGDGSFIWEEGAGNPAPCFRVDDDATGDINYALAPSKFLGNWAGASPASDYVSADIFLHRTSGSYISNSFVFKIKGPGGEATAILNAQPALDTWTTYTAYLDPADWSVSGDWNLLLQQITGLVVRAEYINGDEYVRIDNVTLSLSPEIIPIVPVICSDFDDGGYDGWSFVSTGGVSNASFTGQPGRSLKISDGSGVSIAYPPAKYLGDWTQLDGYSAHIIMDINISSHSGSSMDNGYFIRISGPGGSATFPLNNESISEALSNWNTFVFPVDEAHWIMESGTWDDLLNWVDHMEMAIEFFDGTEVVWMDNFCISNLPPTADFAVSSQVDFIGNPIQFMDKSLSGPSSWLWDFGDMQTSTEKNPVHSYQTTGLFDVKLKASNHFGADSIIKTDLMEILAIDQCLKFEDNFNDNTIYPAWVFKNGTWGEVNGSLRQSSNHYTSNDYLDGCFAVTGSFLWENYLLSSEIMSSDNDYIGFVFNWQDEENMYMFMWSRQESIRKLVKWVDGIETVLAEDDILYDSNRWYAFNILSDNGKLVVAIDGDEVFSVYDYTYSSGKAGLYCWGNQSTYWDNFKIECAASETLLVPAGWSGISSYVIPLAESLESMFNSVLSDLTILQNAAGMFWPGQNVNTLGTWNTHEGYQVKLANDVELTISGTRESNKLLQLVAGWNLIPVLSECDVDVTDLFNGTNAGIVKEVAGTNIYWPEFGINTIGVLEPGKAYFVMMDEAAEITFPECGSLKHSVAPSLSGFQNLRGLTPWQISKPTTQTHIIAIPAMEVSGIQSGNIIGAFDETDNCFGLAVYKSQNNSITLFGDDPTSIEKDGFSEGENISFKLYNPSNKEEFDLKISYENRFDNSGLFYTNGMSVIKNLNFTGLSSMNKLSDLAEIIIYPNPTNGAFAVSGMPELSSLTIVDTYGNEIRDFKILNSGEIDLSDQPKGVYFIRIAYNSSVYFEKLILN